MRTVLTFEAPIHTIERQIAELHKLREQGGPDVSAEVAELEEKLHRVQVEIYSSLKPWDQVQMARHPDRPYTLDYIEGLAGDSFVELHGDRAFGDDPAIVAGLGSLNGRTAVMIGHQKARDLKGRQFRNFGNARPEGYRKAVRVMRLAEKLQVPVISFVDTPAADCSVGSEARGISQAIACSMYEMSRLTVPAVVAIIGEGGSGGAIGIGVGNRVLIMEHAFYSVIPPEGCAALLWKDSTQAYRAAEALKLTAQDSVRLGVVDEVVSEPLGGAHRDPPRAVRNLGFALEQALEALSQLSPRELNEQRYRKFRAMGQYAPAEITSGG